MTGNEIRDTPGRMMLLWAVVCLPLVVFSWRIHLGRGQFDWAEYPTALGDAQYYSDAAMLGENDFFGANLKFDGHSKGLYRLTFKPRTRNDETMRKAALETTGRHFVYTEMKPPKGGPKNARYYLKSAENRYIEFTEKRKFYPEYPLAVPVSKAATVAPAQDR